MSLDRAPAEAYASALAGADYGEAFLEETSWTSAMLEDGRVQDVSVGSDRGLGLHLLRRRGSAVETFFASGPDVGPEAALRLRAELMPASRAPAPRFNPPLSRGVIARIDPAAVPLERKVALLHALDRAVRAEFPSIRQVTVTYSDGITSTRVLNTDGTDARQSLVATTLSVTVVVEEKGRLQTGSESLGGQRGYELVGDGDAPFAAARRAAARALAKLRAPKAKAGEMPVVLSNSAGGTFIHEAIGHSLEADHVQEGSSPAYRGAIGKQIAQNITVIDDPTLPFQRGSYFFDDEGVLAAPTTLVKDGVLTGYLDDRTTALREGRTSNGHGRRECFSDRPFPRMSNLYIAPGQDDPAEIIRGLERGLFVTRMGGGQVNTATGEFVFEVDEGFWVEGGKIKQLVRDANLLGIGPEVLRAIDRVGWDVGWGIGTCGKEGQSVPVSDGQPTIRLPKVVVGGAHEE